jgi:hypothetical protein
VTKGTTSALIIQSNTITLPAVYSWWRNKTSTNPGTVRTLKYPDNTTEYDYSTDDLYVKIASECIALVSDKTVGGTEGEALTGAPTAEIKLYGETFINAGFPIDATSWFASIPAGVNVTAERFDNETIILTFDGTPTVVSNAIFNITIPASVLTGNAAIIVELNVNAKFNIIKAPVVPPPPPRILTYTVTVINGTGSGVFEENDIVTIKANYMSSQQFVRWEISPSVTIATGMNLTSAQLNFLMPAQDVIAKAIYEYIPVINHAIVVLNDGNGTASASKVSAPRSSVITLTAVPNHGYRFKEWIVYKGFIILSNPTDNPAQFRMRDYGVEVMAVFEPDIQSSNEKMQTKTLKAFVQNGTLYVSGIANGSALQVYNVTGSLLYKSIPGSSHEGISSPFEGIEVSLLLPGRGVFIITDGKEVLKVTN